MQPIHEQEADSISIKDVARKTRSGIRYLKTKKIKIFLTCIICGLLGYTYSIYKKPVYTAESTFVSVQGNKGSGLGQYAGLASLAGIDMGSGGSAAGIFQSDNLIELYKSRMMITKTLLSTANFNGKSELLIDRYIDFNRFRDKWKDDQKLKNISFSGDPNKFGRSEDSIITDFVKAINLKMLSVTKPDKKLGIISVSVTTSDELFSKEFNTRLVQTVNDFYTKASVRKSSQNVAILQRQTDSVRSVLNGAINGVASAIDAAPNANPFLVSLRVPSQKRQIDVQSNSAIYGELVKNLELAKMSLRQETPLIQLIDQPVLPLEVSKVGKIKSVLIGLLVGFFASVAVLVLLKLGRNMI